MPTEISVQLQPKPQHKTIPAIEGLSKSRSLEVPLPGPAQ